MNSPRLAAASRTRSGIPRRFARYGEICDHTWTRTGCGIDGSGTRTDARSKSPRLVIRPRPRATSTRRVAAAPESAGPERGPPSAARPDRCPQSDAAAASALALAGAYDPWGPEPRETQVDGHAGRTSHDHHRRGRGIGREHALYAASQGAKVVVKRPRRRHQRGRSRPAPAQQVVDEILASGGEAVANTDSVSDFEGAKRLIDLAVDTFGDLHVLVNNARDPAGPSPGEHDRAGMGRRHRRAPQRPLLPDRHAAAYWREQTKAGHEVRASIVHTSSNQGCSATPADQLRRGESRIAAFSTICAMELGRTESARTRSPRWPERDSPSRRRASTSW